MRSTDVVVIGGGGSGLSAALTAARLGADVVLLEKTHALGGTTGLSVGSISSSCTPHQKEAGIKDTPDEHFEDMGKFAGALEPRDNPALRRLYVDNVPDSMRFLMDLGIQFMGPIPEPPHRYPRLHNIVPHSRGYIYHLARHCRREGVSLQTAARARDLIIEASRVVGVRLDGGEAIRARRGVVIATGDFSSAPKDYKRRFLPPALDGAEGINKNSTGDGQRMAEAIGAEVVNGDLAWGPELRFAAPTKASLVSLIPPISLFANLVHWSIRNVPQGLLRPFLMSFATTYLAPSHGLFSAGAILVNKDGRRFCNELDRPQTHVAAQQGNTAYIVMDGCTAAKFRAWPHYVSTAPGVGYAYLPDYVKSRKDICVSAATIAGLAAKTRLPIEALAETVAVYNAQQGAGGRPALATAPYYALGPLKAWIVFTEGGLRVSERLEVLDADGKPTPGLFAAGSAGQGGLLLEGHGHHLGWAITSGRLAGRSAAITGPQ